ncbi:hypothetical protein PIB30_006430 [Stylosanthes scabra]|uniref:Uncharacterized protein n=1 Tax=Stylosanthes scabra TaxID=79078 RepID=A0ABU6U5R5_9FABA|nr:hypothetical protein [Stylosanthes scabra]
MESIANVRSSATTLEQQDKASKAKSERASKHFYFLFEMLSRIRTRKSTGRSD